MLLLCLVQITISAVLNISKIVSYKAKIVQITKTRNAAKALNEQLQDNIKNFSNVTGLEAIARNNLKMSGEDEVLVIINTKPDETKEEKEIVTRFMKLKNMIKILLQEGFALKDRGHYKHAIEVFYKALEEDNTSTELLFEIADLYYRMQNEERALNYIEQILDRVPEHITALKLLEKIFIDRNALAEAEQTAKNIYCVSHNSNDLAQIFRLLNMQGRFDEIFEYNVENPNSSIYFEQAKALFYKKEFAKAQELLEKAIAEERGNQDILLLLGQVYYAQGKKTCVLNLPQRFLKTMKMQNC